MKKHRVCICEHVCVLSLWQKTRRLHADVNEPEDGVVVVVVHER